jgi:ferric-chelate reductase
MTCDESAHVADFPFTAPAFKAADAQITTFGEEEDVMVRLDFAMNHQQAWSAGQHFFLTFPSLSLVQTHPFTVSSLASENPHKPHHHMYLLRVRKGQTKQIAAVQTPTISTILAGPYGTAFPHQDTRHILAVAGGSGVSFTLPIVQESLLRPSSGVIDFVWIVRNKRDLLWIADELAQLKRALSRNLGLRIAIYVTRDVLHSEKPVAPGSAAVPAVIESSSSDSDSAAEKPTLTPRVQELTPAQRQQRLDELILAPSGEKGGEASRFSIDFLSNHHPDLSEIVAKFRERAAGAGGIEDDAEIVGSGPEDMGADLRKAAAAGNGVSIGERFHWDARE